MAVTNIVHSAITTRNDPLDLLGLLSFRWLVPIWEEVEKRIKEIVSIKVW
jgi:hypothetical protein